MPNEIASGKHGAVQSETGWVRLVVSFPGLVDRYDRDDLQAPLDSLFRKSQPVTAVEKDMSPVLSAT